MKSIFALSLFVLALGFVSCSNRDNYCGRKGATESGLLFPKGKKVTNNNFTGTVWLQNLVTADSTSDVSVGHVTFAPGARSKWHIQGSVYSGCGQYPKNGRPYLLCS